MSGLQNRGSEASSPTGHLKIKSVASGEKAVPLKLPAGMVGSLLLASGIGDATMGLHGVTAGMGTREIQLPRDRGLGITTHPFLYLRFLCHLLYCSNLKKLDCLPGNSERKLIQTEGVLILFCRQ